MRHFRFRAAAALDLRHEQERAAANTLAAREAERTASTGRLAVVTAARGEAESDAVLCARAGGDIGTLEWHRNWIVRLAVGVDEARRDLEERSRLVQKAEEAWREARRKRLGLERMRDRARRRFQHAERRAEQAEFDEIARLRHVMTDS